MPNTSWSTSSSKWLSSRSGIRYFEWLWTNSWWYQHWGRSVTSCACHRQEQQWRAQTCCIINETRAVIQNCDLGLLIWAECGVLYLLSLSFIWVGGLIFFFPFSSSSPPKEHDTDTSEAGFQSGSWDLAFPFAMRPFSKKIRFPVFPACIWYQSGLSQ